MPPLISIVTPCLNSALTIEQTLASVREAGAGPAVEHVVIDGGSTDGTVDLLKAAAGVRWVSEPDEGLSDAMNKGLRTATGRYVGWLNADDYYLPGALEKVVGLLGESPGALWLTGPCLIVDGDGNEIRRPVTAYKRMLLRHHGLRSLLMQNYVASPSTFFAREAALAEGGFDQRFRYSMDYDLWLRLALKEPPLIVDEPLAAFRMAEGSLSMTGFEQQFAEHAQNAREHGAGHPVPVLVNAVLSRVIVAIYHVMQRLRGGNPH